MALQQAAGLPVVQALDFNAILLAASARMSSLPQVCAALSAWADMSEKILKYNPEETLPPRSEADAARFLGAFDNGRTASNYCSSVYWACESALSLWCGWRTDALTVKIRGLRKRAARQATTAGFANVLLEEDMKGVVAKADVSGTMVYPVFALTASQCLFRVQSECIPLEVGAPTEVGRLPLGRHSAVYIEGESTAAVAHFDLDKRKNLPGGAHLSRPCTCSCDPQFCLPHRLKPLLSGRRLGSKVCGCVDSIWARQELRNFAVQANVPQAQNF
jgi:hypothetical protein